MSQLMEATDEMAASDSARAQAAVDLGSLATSITALIGAVGAILGGVATIGGGVGPFVREQGSWLAAACVLVVVGSGAALLAVYRKFGSGALVLRVAAVVSYGLAVLIVLVAAVLAPSRTDAPTVSASIGSDASGALAITGSADTAGLKSTGILHLRVDGVAPDGSTVPIETFSSGGTTDGTAHIAFTTPIRPIEYTKVRVMAWVGGMPSPDTDGGCPSNENARQVGCVLKTVADTNAPQLTVTSSGSGDSQSLEVKVDAHAVQGVLIVAISQKLPAGIRPFYSAVLSPDALGSITRSLSVPLANVADSDFCVVALSAQMGLPEASASPEPPSSVNTPLPLPPCPPPHAIYPWVMLHISGGDHSAQTSTPEPQPSQ